ncbi:lactonase family protein [Shimazuella sp. AN120528]|nr:lactonase family protein [Shimazuella soli]MCH5584284.1 lactonase family protein [Shimazuella soli]
MEGSKFIGYVGTYTNTESKGIYSFELDAKEGQIVNLKVAAELENPTYLAISSNRQYLYSVIKEGDMGGVAAFSMDGQGELTFINAEMSAGSPPCHVSVDQDQRYVFSANYHKGTVESHPISSNNGIIYPPSSIIHHEGTGPDPRQEKPHTHFAAMTPDNNYLAVVELGSDYLITYQIDDNGQLEEVSRLKIRPGSGPRHLVFHPEDPNFAYVMTEFSSEVIVLSYNDKNGSFADIQTISTLPSDFTENNQGSAIHISSDGRYVYAGNRGHNSIVIFEVDEQTKKLTFIDRTSTEGDWPRDFVLDPTEKYVIASNQNSSNLVLFARDVETGKLSLLQNDIQVPNPVCVKF